MPESQQDPMDDGIAADALEAIESPVVLVAVGSEAPTIHLANRAARIEAHVTPGATLATLTANLRMDEPSRAAVHAAVREARAANWTWRQDGALEREASLRLLPQRAQQAAIGILSWQAGPKQPSHNAALMSRFRAVFESALDPMLLADDAGGYVDANPAACAAFGYDPAEFRQRHVTDLLARGTREQWRPAWAAFLAKGRDEGRTLLRDRSGREGVFDYRAVANIQPGLHLSTLRDVTELTRTTASLIEREQQFRLLADHVPDPTFVIGLEGAETGCILYMNHAAEETYGYRREELLGRSLIEVLDTSSTAAHAEGRLVALRAGKTITFEGHHRRKDGTELAIEARARRITWEGRPAILAIDRDITAQKAAAAAAQARSAHAVEQQRLLEWLVRTHITRDTFGPIVRTLTERLAALFDCERVSLWLFESANRDLRCIDLHRRTQNSHEAGDLMPGSLYSAEYEQLSRSRYVDASDPYGDPRTAGYIETYLRPNGITSMLDAAILFSGRGYGTLCLEHVGKAHTWRHDEIEFACTIASQLAVAIESEARAAAEASAREREQFLTAILDGSPIGIQIFGPDGTSRRCNAAQHRLLGIEPGATFDVLTDPVAASTGATAAFLRCRSGEPVELERRKVEGAANGSLQRDLDQLFFPVADHTGAITAVVQFTWDVGDRVEAERMRLQFEAKLRESQKLEAVGLLAGGVAHDFNNILTAVLGFAGVLRDTLGATDQNRDLVEQILKAAERGAGLTRQLLAFGRKQVVRTEVFDPAANLLELEPMLRRLLEANVRFVVDAPASGCIQADRGQFEQVLLNLVINARDAMPDGGDLRVEIRAERSPQHAPIVCVRVSDTGVGMTPDVKAKLFEPFFTTKEKGKGTGLGLATVYGIVTQSGGAIRVDSAPGAGATFELRWPCVLPPDPTSSPAAAAHARPRRGRRILLVEDDGPNRQLAARILRTAGHEVLAAASGEEALAIAAADPAIDMLVTDVVMPGISGKVLAQRLLAARPALRVLFVSGYLADEAMRLDSDGAHVELLQKPYSSSELAGAVERILND